MKCTNSPSVPEKLQLCDLHSCINFLCCRCTLISVHTVTTGILTKFMLSGRPLPDLEIHIR